MLSMPELRSQRLRRVNHQGDALRLGMNWTEEDLGKPQILVESAYGMGHPGTYHFRPLIEEVSNGVFEAGGKPGVFYASDICDGVAQAHAGMSYSLISRDIQTALIERLGRVQPVVLVLAPMLMGRHLEQADGRIWGGGALVAGGILALIAVAG